MPGQALRQSTSGQEGEPETTVTPPESPQAPGQALRQSTSGQVEEPDTTASSPESATTTTEVDTFLMQLPYLTILVHML